MRSIHKRVSLFSEQGADVATVMISHIIFLLGNSLTFYKEKPHVLAVEESLKYIRIFFSFKNIFIVETLMSH